MPEIPQRPPQEIIREAVRKARAESQIWLHKRDESRQEAAEVTVDIVKAINDSLEVTALPKILEFRIGDEDFISTRRMDMSTLQTQYPSKTGETTDIFNASSRVEIPSRFLMNDGYIGILVSPSLFGAEPKEQAEVDYLNEKTEYDGEDGWSHYCKLQHYLQAGGVFDADHWNFSKADAAITVVINKGGKLYMADLEKPIPARHRRTGENIIGVSQIKHNESGNLDLPIHTSFWSEADSKAQQIVDQKYGRFYVVLSGSSETQDQAQTAHLTQLTPSHVRSVV